MLSREVVAAEGHYHRSCYKDYMRDSSKQKSKTDTAASKEDLEEKHCNSGVDAYNKLFHDITRKRYLHH